MTQSATALNRSHQTEAQAASGERMLPRSDGTQRRRSILTKTVQQDVIPRLLEQRSPVPPGRKRVGELQIATLADLTLHADGPAAVDFVTSLLEQGFSAESLYLDLLSPTAALLGQYWDDDVCSFTDVTIGLGHLQHVLRALGPAFFGRHTLEMPNGPRAFLMPLPGEQHAFGLTMLSDFFRRAGWHTWSGVVANSSELQTMVAAEWVDLVGFSLACDEMLDTARAEIAAVRRASRNPAVVVMVGGPPFVSNPDLAEAIGADGTAGDGLQAVAAAQALLPARNRRP